MVFMTQENDVLQMIQTLTSGIKVDLKSNKGEVMYEIFS